MSWLGVGLKVAFEVTCAECKGDSIRYDGFFTFEERGVS